MCSVLMSRIKAGMLSRKEPLKQESTIVNHFCNEKVWIKSLVSYTCQRQIVTQSITVHFRVTAT